MKIKYVNKKPITPNPRDKKIIAGNAQRDTIYTSNPNDPRLKAYSDSLALYKNYKKPPLGYVPITESDSPTAREYVKEHTINQLKNLYYSPTGSIMGNESIINYDPPPKKPVQPVEYKPTEKANVKPKDNPFSVKKKDFGPQKSLPKSINSIKYDASGVNVYLTVNGKTSVMPKKDFASWLKNSENKDMFDSYRKSLANKK